MSSQSIQNTRTAKSQGRCSWSWLSMLESAACRSRLPFLNADTLKRLKKALSCDEGPDYRGLLGSLCRCIAPRGEIHFERGQQWKLHDACGPYCCSWSLVDRWRGGHCRGCGCCCWGLLLHEQGQTSIRRCRSRQHEGRTEDGSYKWSPDFAGWRHDGKSQREIWIKANGRWRCGSNFAGKGPRLWR